MISLAPSFFRGSVSVPDPLAIFGANLTAWYDAAVGVTDDGGTPPRVTNWAEQSGNGGSCAAGSPNGPKYIASDVDGTPSVWFDPTETTISRTLVFAAGFPVSPETTCYLMGDLHNANGLPDFLIWSTTANSGFARAWTANQIPTVYGSGSQFIPAIAGINGWNAVRWGGSNSGALRRVAVNANAQTDGAGAWPAAGNDWLQISRSGAVQHFRGKIKEIVVTNTFVGNADAQHAQMLAYFANRYPTLVPY